MSKIVADPMEVTLSRFRFPRPALPSPSGERAGGGAAGDAFGGVAAFAKCFATVDMVEGVLARRLVAYAIDFLILAVVAGIIGLITLLSFGLLSPITGPVAAVLPFAYHSLFIGGPDSSTIGMSIMGLEVRRWDGGRPGPLQALVMTILFYITLVPPFFLLLGFALFNNLGRTLHDMFSGTVVINRQDGPGGS